MPARNGPVHVVTTTRTYKTHLLRRSYREDGKVKNETLDNLSHLPEPQIDLIRRSLQGERSVPVEQVWQIVASRAHGHPSCVLVPQSCRAGALCGPEKSQSHVCARLGHYPGLRASPSLAKQN
jgi:hypothetical protein